MAEDPFYAPNHKPAAPTPKPTEPLFAFRTAGHRDVECVLRFYGESYGWEAQFFIDGSFARASRWQTREAAVRWAEDERKAIELEWD